MWTRKELKEKGKTSFKRNYWKAVLVALLFSLIAGGFSGGTYTGNFGNAFNGHKITGDNGKYSGLIGEVDDIKEAQEDIDDAKEDIDNAKKDIDDAVEDIKEAAEDGNEIIVGVDDIDDIEKLGEAAKDAVPVGVIVAAVVVGIIVFAIIMVIAFALSAFLLNPIELGCDKFFYKNLDEPAEVAKNVLFAFDNNYLNVVKTMFFRDLYTFLWSLLFVIPGIIKAYEYRMIPYILADDPTISTEEAFAKSREMMTGQKWKAFVLDLSFIGWNILSILTCGILAVFYVAPYQNATNAALYEALNGKDEQIEVIEPEAV